MYAQLMATIFNLLVTPTSESIHNSPTVLLDPKMWRLPLEFRCRQLFKIYTPSYMCFRYHICPFNFRFNTVGL